jgi:Ca2+-transporting ATPase
LLTVFLATTFGPLERLLDTSELSPNQWAICIVLAASIIVVTEVRKILRRRSGPQTTVAPVGPGALDAQPS